MAFPWTLVKSSPITGVLWKDKSLKWRMNRIALKVLSRIWRRHQMETFPRYWPFVRGIHRSPVNSPHKGQWRGALMFSLIYAWTNGWLNNQYAGDLRRHRAHYDVTVMRWLGTYMQYLWYPNSVYFISANKRSFGFFSNKILRFRKLKWPCVHNSAKPINSMDITV